MPPRPHPARGAVRRVAVPVAVLLALACRERPGTRPAAAREPRWEGRPVTSWVVVATDPDPRTSAEGAAALREIGAPAVPYVVRALARRDDARTAGLQLALAFMCPDAAPAIDAAHAASEDDEVRASLEAAAEGVRQNAGRAVCAARGGARTVAAAPRTAQGAAP